MSDNIDLTKLTTNVIPTLLANIEAGQQVNIRGKGLNLTVQSDLTDMCSSCPHKNIRCSVVKKTALDGKETYSEKLEFVCCSEITEDLGPVSPTEKII